MLEAIILCDREDKASCLPKLVWLETVGDLLLWVVWVINPPGPLVPTKFKGHYDMHSDSYYDDVTHSHPPLPWTQIQVQTPLKSLLNEVRVSRHFTKRGKPETIEQASCTDSQCSQHTSMHACKHTYACTHTMNVLYATFQFN